MLKRSYLYSCCLWVALSAAGSASADSERGQPANSAIEQTGNDIVEEVIVIAHPLSSEGLAQPTTVLEGDSLNRAVAGTLGETLVNQPGIHSNSFGQAVGRPIIRGLGGARVRVMEDRIDALDVSVSSPDHATTIEPFLADRIEVLKGPSTLLYGNGAIGGVVDVHSGRIPHSVPDRLQGKIELRQADNADLDTAAGRFEAGVGRFSAHLDAFYRQAEDYRIPGYARSKALRMLDPDPDEIRAVLPGSDLQSQGGAVGASYVHDQGFIGMALSRYESDYGLPGAAEEDGTPALEMTQDRADLEAALLNPFRGATNLNLRVGYNHYEHVEIEPSGEPGTSFDNAAIEARLELLHEPVLNVTGAVGVQIAAREYTAIGEEAFVPPVDTSSMGIFYVGERSFARFDLETGFRYERVSHDPRSGPTRRYDLGALSFGLIVPFENGWSLTAQLDYSSRAPAVEELFSNGPHLATRSYQIGDPDLNSEQAVNLSGTLAYEGERYRLGASLYVTDFSDFVFEQPNGAVVDGLPVFEWRQADASFRGIDAEAEAVALRFDQGKLSFRVFYDQVRARLSKAAGLTGTARNLPRIPPERYGLGVRLDWRLLTATVDYARTEAQTEVTPFELPTAGFNDLRAYAGLNWLLNDSALEVFVVGRNLTDAEQRQHTSFIKDIAPQPGRTLEGGVRLTF